MKRFFIGILGGFAVVTIIFFVGYPKLKDLSARLDKISVGPTETPSAPATIGKNTTTRQTKAEDFILLSSQGNEGEWKNLYLFNKGTLKTVDYPKEAIRSIKPVSDGSRIYYVVKNGNTSTKLVAVSLENGKEEVVTDSTPLVTPHNVFASNDGKIIAFFLDGEKNATELWTYDVAKKRKRVSLERLTQEAVGPFWDSNGGFLVLDQKQLLRGTPDRTGTDILPTKVDWEKILEANAIIPSPGGTQVIYLEKAGEKKDSSIALKVWDLKEQSSRSALSISEDQAAILGWSSSGALLVRSGTNNLKIWSVTKTGNDSYFLDAGSSSPVIAGDGQYMANILSNKNGEQLVIREPDKGGIKSSVSLPVSDTDSSEKDKNAKETFRFEILQYLRTKSTSASVQPAQYQLAEEAIVGYVMQHIRQIAEAPEGEPVTAERVLFTRTSGAVYVDYLVGATTWRRLIQVDGDILGRAKQYKFIGAFTPTNGEWSLAKGEDLDDKTTENVYEFDSDSGKWFKKEMTINQL